MDVLVAASAALLVARWMKYSNRYALLPYVISDVFIIVSTMIMAVGMAWTMVGRFDVTAVVLAVVLADLAVLLTSFVDSLIARGMIVSPQQPTRPGR